LARSRAVPHSGGPRSRWTSSFEHLFDVAVDLDGAVGVGTYRPLRENEPRRLSKGSCGNAGGIRRVGVRVAAGATPSAPSPRGVPAARKFGYERVGGRPTHQARGLAVTPGGAPVYVFGGRWGSRCDSPARAAFQRPSPWVSCSFHSVSKRLAGSRAGGERSRPTARLRAGIRRRRGLARPPNGASP
jgi:hypothetical protein